MKMVRAIREKLRQRRNTRATIEQLNKLSDSELKDIGLCRGDIRRVAEGILDIHRTVRDSKGDDT